MAIRTNCIEYGWQTDSSTVQSGSYFSSSKQIYIPETQSRVFRDVTMMLHSRNSGLEVSQASFMFTMSIQIDNNPTSSQLTQTVNNFSPAQVSYNTYLSASDYFNTYFTSSNHSVRLYLKSNNMRTIGHSFKLISTYTFDDSTVNNSIKTVRLPINSITRSSLTSTEVYLGNYTASIPALDTYLPENNKTYRDIFIEYHANDASTAATKFQLNTRIDSAAQTSRFVASQSLFAASPYYEIQTLSGSITTNVTHSIKIATNVSNRFTGIGAILHCTYEYDYTGSTRILNSNIYSIGNPSIFSDYGEYAKWTKQVYIPETGSIQIAKSGILCYMGGRAPNDISIATDTSSFVRYTLLSGSIQTGYTPIIHQIDGTGSQSPALILNSGVNNISVYTRMELGSASNRSNLLGGLLFLNYYSGLTGTPLNHTHTIYNTGIFNNSFSSATSGVDPKATPYYYVSASILDDKYFIVNVTNLIYYAFTVVSSAPLYYIAEGAYYYTGSDNYSVIDNPRRFSSIGFVNNSGRNFYAITANDMTPDVRSTSIQYDSKFNIFNTHKFAHRSVSGNTAINQFSHLQLLTYHSITFPITGSIINYSGSGLGIPLSIYDYDTGEKLFVTQSQNGGVINAYWYNKHTNLMIVAETGSKYMSNILPAGSGSFLITIPSSSPASGEKSFTFIG